MSYDLMIFDSGVAPQTRAGFAAWYRQISTDEPTAPSAAAPPFSPALAAWFQEIISEYPPMNGPHAVADADNPKVTDYDLGPSHIYCSFAWSQARSALKVAASLARKHGVGIYALSDRGEPVWRPLVPGLFEVFYCLHRQGEEVPSERPATMVGSDIALWLLPRLESESDFVGVVDHTGTTLQFIYEAERERFWIEIPAPQRRGSYGTHLSRERLASILPALPEEFTVEAFPEFRFQAW